MRWCFVGGGWDGRAFPPPWLNLVKRQLKQVPKLNSTSGNAFLGRRQIRAWRTSFLNSRFFSQCDLQLAPRHGSQVTHFLITLRSFDLRTVFLHHPRWSIPDVYFQTLFYLCVGSMGIAFNGFQMDGCFPKQLLLSAAGRTGKG